VNRRFWFLPVAIFGTVADLLTKRIAFSHIDEGQVVPVVPDILRFVRSVNTGGLFGMMQGWTLFLAAMTVLAFGVIVWFLLHAPAGERWTPIALGFVAAGAAGNFYDRIFCGGVRDFIDVNIPGVINWPAFNVADVFICIGAGMIIVSAFKRPQKHAAKKSR